MNKLAGPLVKSLVFVAVTVFATTMLALTIVNGASGGTEYHAVFTDATSLNSGDDVRMAGVRVGQVDEVTIHDRRQVRVGFAVRSDLRLADTVTATIKYRSLIGQRYIELDQGTGTTEQPLRHGATIPLSRTEPALDLTVLFNGFQPLFEGLAPDEFDRLSAAIIQVFQGEGPTIESLLDETGTLTKSLADRDRVIKRVVDNLEAVMAAIQGRGNQLTTLVKTLQTFVSGLSADRTTIGTAVTNLAGLTTGVSDLARRGRPALKTSIDKLADLSQNLAGSSGALNSFLQTLPTKLTKIGRAASYGSWVNLYLCSVTGRIPVPTLGGPTDTGSAYGNVRPDGSVSSKGLVGVDNPAARCGR